MLTVLRERFGLQSFRPGQAEVIQALLDHKAALAVFPTGAGKSLCFQLPALMLEGLTVVVSPLIALMKDQIDALTKRGVAAARLDSSLSEEEARSVADQMRAGTLSLLYVAPERFNNERFRELMSSVRVALFAIDEAHCVSEWGHNFRPDYLKLAGAAKAIKAERVLALTATATPKVVGDICRAFDIAPADAVVTGFYRSNLSLRATAVTVATRDSVLLQRLRSRPPGATIVYVTLQRTSEEVAATLAAQGLPARAYHAGMTAEARSDVQEWWRAGSDRIVVATIAFGMGIDKADVRYVYHYNLPKGLESYSQEIGRAGRDGEPSTVEILVGLDDVPVLENFVYGDTPTREALHALVERVLAEPQVFEASLFTLSNELDMRSLVLKTALTYLELEGVIEEGTARFDKLEVKLTQPIEQVSARFDAERAAFVQRVFEHAKKGRIWYSLDPAEVARAMGEDRARVTRAIDYLATQGLAEVKASEVRHRYKRLATPDIATLVDKLDAAFTTRERQELQRLQQVLSLVTSGACIANALAAHFGEQRAKPCGQCEACVSGGALSLMAPAQAPWSVDDAAIDALRVEHAKALAHPRQLARFLCGLTSPATSRARLGSHRLFGALATRPFAEVLKRQ